MGVKSTRSGCVMVNLDQQLDWIKRTLGVIDHISENVWEESLEIDAETV